MLLLNVDYSIQDSNAIIYKRKIQYKGSKGGQINQHQKAVIISREGH